MKISLAFLSAALMAAGSNADVLHLGDVSSSGGQDHCEDVGLSSFPTGKAKFEADSGDFCPGSYSGNFDSQTCLGVVDLVATCPDNAEDQVEVTATYTAEANCRCQLKVKVKGGTYTALYLSQGAVLSGHEYLLTADGDRPETQGAGISNVELCLVCDEIADGDPHFLTWNQEWYDFHGECDLVLLDAPDFGHGAGLTTHIRTRGRYEYSYIEAAAIRIGDETFEVGSYGTYMLNGVESTGPGRLHAGIAGYPITHTKVNKKTDEFKIELAVDQFIHFRSYKDLVGVRFEGVYGKEFESSLGMMGHYRTGEHLARDGKTIIEDDNEFGLEWVVGVNDPQIFVSPSQGNLGECKMPSATQRRLGAGGISLEAAKLACARMGHAKDQCIFDVMATGDLGFAEAGAF